jgi:hypothetical protein
MNVAEIVGYVVIVAVCVMLVAAAVAAACGAVQKLLDRHAAVVSGRVRREIGTAMACDAWWFRDGLSAQQVLRLYGRDLAEGLVPNPGQIRERATTAETVSEVR